MMHIHSKAIDPFCAHVLPDGCCVGSGWICLAGFPHSCGRLSSHLSHQPGDTGKRFSSCSFPGRIGSFRPDISSGIPSIPPGNGVFAYCNYHIDAIRRNRLGLQDRLCLPRSQVSTQDDKPMTSIASSSQTQPTAAQGGMLGSSNGGRVTPPLYRLTVLLFIAWGNVALMGGLLAQATLFYQVNQSHRWLSPRVYFLD